MVACRLYLDFEDITSGNGHYISLGQGEQLFQVLSRSNMAERSYGLDKDFGYVSTVTFTLESCIDQSHGTSLCHKQQLCEVLSRPNIKVRSYM